MNVKEENDCRFCLNNIIENEFEAIDDRTREICQFLFQNINLDLSREAVMCLSCADIMKKCYLFKSSYIDMEATVNFSDTKETEAKPKSADIFKQNADVGCVNEDSNKCKFCLTQVENGNIISIDVLIKEPTFSELWPIILPKMGVNFTKNHMICMQCKKSLSCYFTFVLNCLETKRKIDNYCQEEGTDSIGQIKVSNLQHFVFKNTLEPPTKRFCIREPEEAQNVRLEECPVIKAEEEDIKEEVVLEEDCLDNSRNSDVMKAEEEYVLEAGCQDHSKNNIPTEALRCPICSYRTEFKSCIEAHVLTHKKTSQLEIYKCSKHDLKTKSKSYFNFMHTRNNLPKAFSGEEIGKCKKCMFDANYQTTCEFDKSNGKEFCKTSIYKCDTRDYDTKQNNYIKSHALFHKNTTKRDVYKCTKCSYETTFNNCFNVHMHTHIKLDTELYRRSRCNYETKYKDTLKRHILTHQPSCEMEQNPKNCLICSYDIKF